MKDFFIYKTACLLHDPPNKAWLVSQRRNHKKEALKTAQRILEFTCLEGAFVNLESMAKPADIQASSVDRWLLSILVGDDYSRFPTTELKLKNVFNPEYSVDIPEKHIDTDSFSSALNKLIDGIDDPCIAYHLLYAVYEAEWILQGYPSSPADTRAPSHTVFDHGYATASIANWLYQTSTSDGILLFMDLGGVQSYISDSRKLIDLWASSYIASMLSWSVIWTFVKTLGPDITIVPTCRGNPFYYHSLIAELLKRGVNKEVVEKLKEITRKLVNYDPDRDVYPQHAVVPATASILLPRTSILKEFEEFREIGDTAENLEEFVKKRYKEIWRTAFDTVVEACQNLKQKRFFQDLSSVLEKSREFGFDEVPPLPLRVVALFTDNLASDKKSGYRLYHEMFELLAVEVEKRKIYRPSPFEELKLYDMTVAGLDAYPVKSRKGFDYCSVCGKLPAVVIIPSKEEEYKEICEGLEPVFTMGERLCPYCTTKRLLLYEDVRKAVIERIIGKAAEVEKAPSPVIQYDRTGRRLLRFPSVSDIAAKPFLKSLLSAARTADQDDVVAESLTRVLNDFLKNIGTTRTRILELMGIRNQELREIMEFLVASDAETLFFQNRGACKTLLAEIGSIKELKEVGLKQLTAYYCILKCDGDNFGKILRGFIEEGLRQKVGDYLVNSLEGPARSLVSYLLQNRIEEARTVAQGVDDSRLSYIESELDSMVKSGRIIVSPSFHAALSRCLMATAVRDSNIVEKHDGVTIYAGGDDLLAVLPVESSLKAAEQLRRRFSLPVDDSPGFDRVENFQLPSLACAGRSFALYLTHYMFPLYMALSKVLRLLETHAKKVVWMKDGSRVKKDSLVLAYSPRGGETTALIPLFSFDGKMPLGEHVAKIDECVKSVESKEPSFAVSLIYDLLKSGETIQGIISNGSVALFKEVLENIFERNKVGSSSVGRQISAKWSDYLSEYFGLKGELDGRELSFVLEWIRALRVFRSGLRGVE